MKIKPSIEYNPQCKPEDVHGYRHVRFVERPKLGLRFVGYADDVYPSYIQHTGWFTDDDGDFDKYRGVVYQLPARNGKECFVYGYEDPNMDGALLDFDVEEDKKEAARQADRMAEIFAEHERDYQRAWRAGRRYEDLADEIKSARDEAREIGAELRAARGHVASLIQCGLDGNFPRSCATLRERVFELRRQITKMRKERKSLLSDYGRQPGFVE